MNLNDQICFVTKKTVTTILDNFTLFDNSLIKINVIYLSDATFHRDLTIVMHYIITT